MHAKPPSFFSWQLSLIQYHLSQKQCSPCGKTLLPFFAENTPSKFTRHNEVQCRSWIAKALHKNMHQKQNVDDLLTISWFTIFFLTTINKKSFDRSERKNHQKFQKTNTASRSTQTPFFHYLLVSYLRRNKNPTWTWSEQNTKNKNSLTK